MNLMIAIKSTFISFVVTLFGMTTGAREGSAAAPAVQWVALPRPETAHIPGKVILPAARDYTAPGGLPQRMLFDFQVRDPYILTAPNGYYYMVATASRQSLPPSFKSRPDSSFWEYNDGIPLWRSKDLVNWETMGYVWKLDEDATWAKAYKNAKVTNGKNVRAVWAPEIHYLKSTYWIVYSMNYSGTGLLKSTSGLPEGPYVDIKPDGPINGAETFAIDPSIFEDSNGTVYYLDCESNIARMKPDLSGLAETVHKMEFKPRAWGEGINLMKVNGKYIWIGAGVSKVTLRGKPVKTYDCFSATSDSPYGPYTNRSRAIPYAGHNNLFQDKQGQWWSTRFAGQPFLPSKSLPHIVPVSIDNNGIVSVKRAYPRPAWSYTTAAPSSSWNRENFDERGWQKGEAGFGDAAVTQAGPVTDVGTAWKKGEIWMRRSVDIADVPLHPALFLRHNGPVEVWFNGHQVYASADALEDYRTHTLESAPLHPGRNTIAVHAQAGPQPAYIDVGMVDLADDLSVK